MLLSDIRDLLFPRYCKVCGRKLVPSEKHLCINCLRMLPLTHFEEEALNPMMQKFMGDTVIRRASAWLYYEKEHAHAHLIHHAKYFNHPEVGTYLGRCAATAMKESGFFNDIDGILPVPLSRHRQRKRGYNQCDFIARGVSEVTGIPVIIGNLIRTHDNPTQTYRGRTERQANVQDIFAVKNPEALKGRTLLLLDDVITTGATLRSCATTLEAQVPDIRIIAFTLAYAND